MVRFINKNLKSHSYTSSEPLNSLMDNIVQSEIAKLLAFHFRDFGKKSSTDLTHLLQKTTIQLGLSSPREVDFWFGSGQISVKEFFLLIELILETYVESNKRWLEESYILDFVNDINDFFLIHKVPLSIRYFSNKKEFYVEKIISPEISKEIKKTLEDFSKEEKVFEDFKEAIKKYSSGNYEGSIEKCCVSIEDYLCILLEKKTCSSIDKYYKDIAKRLKIPEDLNDRFTNIIHYIHKHRSHQNHGSIEKKVIEDIELINEIIIGFTMTILNYLKKKNEKS